MNDLALRLAALDPEVGAALRAVGHFDALLAARAGLHDVVRALAELVGCPARFVDPARGLVVRVGADGEPGPSGVVDPRWPVVEVVGGGQVLLERAGPAGTRDAVVLERAAAAVGTVLARTRSAHPGVDPASVEVVLDAGADPADRLAAARRLGVVGPARAVALPAGGWLVLGRHDALPTGLRCGLGPVGEVLDLPTSAEAARTALRLTAEGTEDDPGPRLVDAAELGAVLLLVRAADAAAPAADVRALDTAAAAGPWVLSTLEAVAGTTSLRDAARAVHLHHSSLQDRLVHAEQLLGWDVRSPGGRLRLQLALHLRRAARSREGWWPGTGDR